MRNLLFTLLDLAGATARLCGPGGVRAVIAENLLFKQELLDARDLERKLAEFQIYYNAARCHASLDGRVPLTFGGQTLPPAQSEPCALGLPLPRPRPAPGSGLTGTSRPTG